MTFSKDQGIFITRKKPDEKVLAELDNIEDLFKVKAKLEQRWLTNAKVTNILGISNPQLLYWHGIVSGGARPKSRWRRFSVSDLLSYGILKYLRGLQIQLELCRRLLKWTRENFASGDLMIFPFSDGESILLIADCEKIGFMIGSEVKDHFRKAHVDLLRPFIVIPLSLIFRDILRKVHRDTFYVELGRDSAAKRNKVIYVVDDEKIELKKPKVIELYD